MTVEKNLHDILIDQELTLSLAESATGGALAARMTSQPGASAYFLGSIVAYCNNIKVQCLGVKERTLDTKGAVSSQVVEEMVLGVRELMGSDCAIAVSGIAGPSGGSPNHPIGTHWGAIVVKGQEPVIWSFHIEGNRSEIIEQAVDILLKKAVERLTFCCF